MNEQEAFLNILIAMMSDAAAEGKLSQVKTQIDPDGKGLRIIRIIVIPEKMEFDFNPPLGSETAAQ